MCLCVKIACAASAVLQRQAATTDCMLGLSVALDHPAISSDPKVLCAAACACKGWREAVLQSGACNTVITLDADKTLLQHCSFMQWLAKHAPLVKSITAVRRSITSVPGCTVHGLQREQHVATLQQLLQQALQLAASPAPAATAQQQQQQRQQRGLRLSSFTSNCLVAPGMLAALPAHSLTHLKFDVEHSKGLSGKVLAAALAQLSSLRHLNLENNSQKPVAGGCLSGLAQLKQLTTLKLLGNRSDSAQPLQQLLAQPLPLRQLHIRLCGRSKQQMPALNMAALVSLQEFTAFMELPEGIGAATAAAAAASRSSCSNCKQPVYGVAFAAAAAPHLADPIPRSGAPAAPGAAACAAALGAGVQSRSVCSSYCGSMAAAAAAV
jgi:hypothetical protein